MKKQSTKAEKEYMENKKLIEQIERLSTELYSMTRTRCLECSFKECKNCCDNAFCKLNDIFLQTIDRHYGIHEKRDPKYLGNNGCIIPPEHRPLCSIYICASLFDNEKFDKFEWREKTAKLFNLLDKLNPNIRMQLEKQFNFKL